MVSECPDHYRPLPHRTAVLNSVEYDFSNGPVEGINRRIKSLKRSCFGFRNLDNFRKRRWC
ncbi:transposase [Ligilactobacillus ruminis]|uniref:transposase n=1 Tax=Ligilactobacillus ruminis TaxID=1623 RepID=UPI003A52374C